MARLSIRLLGQLQVSLHDEVITAFESDKVRALLVYLAVEADRVHRREALASLLWPDKPDGSALNNLRGALSNLRKAIDDRSASPSVILATRQTIQFNKDSDSWLDVAELNDVLDNESNISTRSLEEIIDLYQGSFLEGFSLKGCAAYEEWAMFKREQLGREISQAYEHLITQLEQEGEYERALNHTWRWVELEPLDENAHRHLMRLLAASGQRATALSQYETLSTILADELDVEPSEETQALHQDLLKEELEPPKPRATQVEAPDTPAVVLPAQTTPFVGRKNEIDQITEHLKDKACRLITLTGPGGIGKTRLVLQVAQGLASEFFNGVFFIPLAPLTSPEFLVSATASALRFSFYGPEDTSKQLLNNLRDKEALLVFDNFEHLLEGVGFVKELLEQAPNVKVLATSRERLNLQGEWIIEIDSMSFPDEGVKEGIEQYEAVQLFLHCARRVRPEYELSDTEIPFVVQICQLMEGMPLGIELSSAWLRTLSTAQIASEIEGGVEFLSSSLRDVPERHRSLWAVFDHSWRLLSEEEQAAFRKLSVFRGGFEREAAANVAGATLPILSALVDKSLIRRVESGRYESHELLRQYAVTHLTNAGEGASVHRRHRNWFLNLAEQLENQLVDALWGSAETELVDRVRVERDNFRLALQWSIEQGEGEEALRLAISLTWFWYVRADFTEGRRWLDRSMALGKDASHHFLALAAHRAGVMAITQHDFQRGVELAERALQFCYETGNLREAGWTLYHIGYAAMQQGDFEQAGELYNESIELFRQIDYAPGVASIQAYLGIVAYHQKEYARAASLIAEGLPVLREARDQIAIARALHGLGQVALQNEEFDQAANHLQEALTITYGIGARLELVQCIEGLAALGSRMGEFQRGATLFGFSEQLRHSIGTPLSSAELNDHEAFLSTIRDNLEEGEYADLRSQGEKMTMEEAVAFALGEIS